MSLYDQIIKAYPELTSKDFLPSDGVIALQNDSDNLGDYITKWNYSEPIPKGLKLGKPTK